MNFENQLGFAKPGRVRLTVKMLLNLISRRRARHVVAAESLLVGTRAIPLLVIRNPRARRYHLRLQADGSARVTIPRGGSQAAAQAFVERNRGWLAKQIDRLQAQPPPPTHWRAGSEILWRGELVRLEAGANGSIRVGTEVVNVNQADADLRSPIERHFRFLARQELPARVAALAALHQLSVCRVTVRNQRSRWGSCSRRGAISLNWRLIQTPVFVRDYIILHELAHLREMNHSGKFWQEVERLCPEYRLAEQWLKTNRWLLR